MRIILQCPRCSSRWWLDGDAADRRLRCRRCELLLKVPRLDELPKAVEVIKDAKDEVYVDDNGRTYG